MKIVTVNYHDTKHAVDLVGLLDEYARDPFGGDEALSDETKTHLVSELAALPHAFSVLAYDDDIAVGLVNCFYGFSTFSCKKTVNIHDVVVKTRYRGKHICQKMFAHIETLAKEADCCKLTLEVLENNESAKRAYQHYGFEGYRLLPETGVAQFWQKVL